MSRPTTGPSMADVEPWKRYAIEYLRSELKSTAPDELNEPQLCNDSPLEGEGAIVAFPFMADFGVGVAQKHWVIVGQTEPNYYPHYDLEPLDLFCLHWGTRFMSVLSVPQADAASSGEYDPTQDARHILDRIAPRKPIEKVEVAVTFDVEGEKHSVLRCRLDDESIYIFGRDAPPGFSRRADLPPHVAYRIHIGRVLLREPEPVDETSRGRRTE